MSDVLDDGTPNPNPDTTPAAPVAASFTQEQVSAIAAKEAKAARAKAQSDFLSGFGLESADDMKAIVEAHRANVEANKSAETRVAEMAAQMDGFKATAASAQAVIQGLLDAETAAIPEDKRSIVPDFGDPAKSLAWISANRALIGGTPVGASVINIGTGAAPAAQGQASTLSFKEFSELTPGARIQFYTDFPEQAAQYSLRWLDQ